MYIFSKCQILPLSAKSKGGHALQPSYAVFFPLEDWQNTERIKKEKNLR